MCICIRMYARNDLRGVLFLCVTVNVEPYGTVQIVLLWSHNGFHERSVTKLLKLLSNVLFHGGTALTVYIDCQQALPELRNSIITRF